MDGDNYSSCWERIMGSTSREGNYGASTSRGVEGETVEAVADLIFGGSKITADGDCSQEIKRRKEGKMMEGKL